MDRRSFLRTAAGGAAATALGAAPAPSSENLVTPQKHPNLVFVFGDQWRAQATGYAGDTNVQTPHLDRLAAESLNFTHAVSGCPVCTPYRASLLTGQYWLTHGVFMNDVCLSDDAISMAEAYNEAGYDTGYIGKWHLDGHGRLSITTKERRQGFQFWKALECDHNYNDSFYYSDTPEKIPWEGYDAIAQTRAAQEYMRDPQRENPFALFLSWGPPHAPYQTAPKEYRDRYRPEDVVLRPNVPPEQAEAARKSLAGYYAHIAALDDCIGDLVATLDETGQTENTIFVFTSDHGDMLHSQGQQKKQRPYEESIRVPFLLRYPKVLGAAGRELPTLLNTPDIMPTLLGLSGVDVPESVEGSDFSAALLRGETPKVEAAKLTCVAPFGQWLRSDGGREYRGIRTPRYTYVRDREGPWLLYDNETDPYQQTNRCNGPDHAETQARLDAQLDTILRETKDEFLPGDHYVQQWGYPTDETGTVPYGP